MPKELTYKVELTEEEGKALHYLIRRHAEDSDCLASAHAKILSGLIDTQQKAREKARAAREKGNEGKKKAAMFLIQVRFPVRFPRMEGQTAVQYFAGISTASGYPLWVNDKAQACRYNTEQEAEDVLNIRIHDRHEGHTYSVVREEKA